MRKYNRIVYYNKDGQRGRNNDLPAIEYADRSKYWYQNGERHRDNGAAVEFSSGSKIWYWKGNHCGTGNTPPEKYLRLKNAQV